MTDYSKRLPAAIAEGERRLGGWEWRVFRNSEKHCHDAITAGEVAMAKLALRLVGGGGVHPGPEKWLAEDEAAAPLRDFMEKMRV